MTASDFSALLRQLGDFAEIRGASLDATAWRRLASDIEQLGAAAIARLTDLARHNRAHRSEFLPALQGEAARDPAGWPDLTSTRLDLDAVAAPAAARVRRRRFATARRPRPPGHRHARRSRNRAGRRTGRQTLLRPSGTPAAGSGDSGERTAAPPARTGHRPRGELRAAGRRVVPRDRGAPPGRRRPTLRAIRRVPRRRGHFAGSADDAGADLRYSAGPGALFQTSRRVLLRYQQTEIDIRIAARDEYGSALHVATGAPAHVAAVRARHASTRSVRARRGRLCRRAAGLHRPRAPA